MVNHDQQLQRSPQSPPLSPPPPRTWHYNQIYNSPGDTDDDPSAYQYHLPAQQPPRPQLEVDCYGCSSVGTGSNIHENRIAVDYTSTVAKYVQYRMSLNSRDRPVVEATPARAIDMLPPAAYADNPSSIFAAKLAYTRVNKLRSSINCVLWTPSGSQLITGSQNRELTIWKGGPFLLLRLAQAHDYPITAMVWSYNEYWMVTGDDGGFIKYWQSSTMNNFKVINSHKESIRGLRTDLKYCSCSDDCTIKVWDFGRCQEDHTLTGHSWDVKCVDWHPTKSLLISGGRDNVVKLWDAKSGKDLASFYLHKGPVNRVKWNTNGNWVISSSSDSTIKLYDIRAMKELETFRGYEQDVTALAWHPSHEDYFVSGSLNGTICHWLVEYDVPLIKYSHAHDNSISDLSWHPIGHLLCSGSSDTKTKFWCRNRHPSKYGTNYGNSRKANNPTPGLERNGPIIIPGMGVSGSIMPTQPIDTSTPLSISMPSLINPNQQKQFYRLQNAQKMQPLQLRIPQKTQHLQPFPQITSFSEPLQNLHQLQPPSPRMPWPIHQLPPQGIMASPMLTPVLMGMQGSANQVVPISARSIEQGGVLSGLQTHQGSSNAGRAQMYPGTTFDQPKVGQMPPMSDHNQYQDGNQNLSGLSQLPSNFVLPSVGQQYYLPPYPCEPTDDQ